MVCGLCFTTGDVLLYMVMRLLSDVRLVTFSTNLCWANDARNCRVAASTGEIFELNNRKTLSGNYIHTIPYHTTIPYIPCLPTIPHHAFNIISQYRIIHTNHTTILYIPCLPTIPYIPTTLCIQYHITPYHTISHHTYIPYHIYHTI